MEAAPQIDPFKATINAMLSNDFATAINYLSRVGFNINQEDPFLGRHSYCCTTKKCFPVVQRLIQIPELQVNYTDKSGATPLMVAARYSSPPVINELLKRRDVLVNEMTPSGESALDFANANPHAREVAHILRAHRALTGKELSGEAQPPPAKEETTFAPALYAKLGLSPAANPHQILGIPSDASAEQIKAAFRAKTREWHPDRNPDPMAKEVIQLINFAYKKIGPK